MAAGSRLDWGNVRRRGLLHARIQALGRRPEEGAMADDPADDTRLRQILQRAADRFYANLNAALPRTAPLIAARLKRVPAGPRTVEVCLATQSFPAFSMPWWITPAEARRSDDEFLEDLCYST